jgi:hypothetical protein
VTAFRALHRLKRFDVLSKREKRRAPRENGFPRDVSRPIGRALESYLAIGTCVHGGVVEWSKLRFEWRLWSDDIRRVTVRSWPDGDDQGRAANRRYRPVADIHARGTSVLKTREADVRLHATPLRAQDPEPAHRNAPDR